MKNLLQVLRKHTMQIVLVLALLFFTLMTQGKMLSPANMSALIAQNAYVFILATGMLMCMLTGGNIDLSVGSAVCLLDVLGGIMMVRIGWPVPVAMLLMLVCGLIIGSVLGYVIAYLNIPPWIATLAGYLAFRGWGTALLGNATIGGIPDGFLKLFNGTVPDIFGVEGFNVTCFVAGIIVCLVYVFAETRSRATKLKKGYEADTLTAVVVRCVIICAVVLFYTYKLAMSQGIPMNLIWVMVVVLIYNFITSKTTIGRYFYTIGGNVEATRLSGIDTKRIYFLAYLNMQFLTVIAAWMTLARQTSAAGSNGTNFEMDAISACVVGGVSAYGGSGTVFGMVVGATLIGVINMGMNLMGIDANWQKVVKGLVLLAAVVFEILNNKDKTKA
ncbi:MAG: sugar ABC transporter permease [Lachnospiraceae bacterium]